MDLQQAGSLAIVLVTAVLMVRGALRRRSRGPGRCCDSCPEADKTLVRPAGRRSVVSKS